MGSPTRHTPSAFWYPTCYSASNLGSRHGGNREGLFRAWGKILAGYTLSLSIEITRECPLQCPGCYAYGSNHLGGVVTLRQVSDYTGQERWTPSFGQLSGQVKVDSRFMFLSRFRLR